MTYKEKFMADHADMPTEEAEELMLETCPFTWDYQNNWYCPVAENLLTYCAECWNREAN